MCEDNIKTNLEGDMLEGFNIRTDSPWGSYKAGLAVDFASACPSNVRRGAIFLL
jgi:hypothetical protein